MASWSGRGHKVGWRACRRPLGSRGNTSQSSRLDGQTARSCLCKSFPLSLILNKGIQSRGRVPAPARASKGGQCSGGLSTGHRSQGGTNEGVIGVSQSPEGQSRDLIINLATKRHLHTKDEELVTKEKRYV